MGNKFKNYLTSLGFNYKKEIFLIFLFNILSLIAAVVVYYFTKTLYIALCTLLAIPVINFLFYYRYSSKKKYIQSSHEEEFVTIVSYFQIFIANHFNVYTAFKSIIPYCSEWMGDKINIFLFEVDSDKTIKPFIDFRLICLT